VDRDALDLVTSLIGNLGFPIAITIYVLVRLDKALSNIERESSKAIKELASEVHVLGEELARLEGLLTASLGRR